MRATLLILLATVAMARAEPNLKDGDRVLFYGDIGARSSAVAERVESFFALRDPRRAVSMRHFEIRRTSSVKDATPDFADLLSWNEPKIVVLALGPAVISEEKLPDDATLATFEQDVAVMLSRAAAVHAKVLMVTPTGPFLPSYTEAAQLSAVAAAAKKQKQPTAMDLNKVLTFPYGASTADEAGRFLDQAIAKMAETLRRVAKSNDAELIDAHAEMKRFCEAHADRIRGYPVQGKDPRESAVRREALVNALAVNLTAGMLLDGFGAEPLDVRIRFEWNSGSAESSAGTAELIRVSDDTRRIVLKSLPITWDLGERGPAWWDLNPAGRYCHMILQVGGLPAGAATISDGTMNTLSVSAAELGQGFNLACAGPLPTSQAAAQLANALSRVTRAAGHVAAYRKEVIEEPEFAEPHKATLHATEMWLDAYERVLARTPRTLDIALDVTVK